MRSTSSLVLALSLFGCHATKEINPVEPDPSADIPAEERTLLEAELDVLQSEQDEPVAAELSETEVSAWSMADKPETPTDDAERTEIDFEGLDLAGELVKPQGALILDRRSTTADGAASSQANTGGGASLGTRGGMMASDSATSAGRQSGSAAGTGLASGYGSGAGSLGTIGTGRGGGGDGVSGSLSRSASVSIDATSSANQFTDHGVNPFTMVADDSKSTFSIDVDTASYTLTRRFLQGHRLPPYQSVRVEEFVNSVDYDYPAPLEEALSVHMEAMPDPFTAGHHILRVGLKAAAVDPDERQPVHLTFLVDVSGSMRSADKLGLAKDSLRMLVGELRLDDTVAIVTYAGSVERILEPTSAARSAEIYAAIERLHSGGSTAMSSGLDLAYEMAGDSFVQGHENRVLVLSDGDANVGKTSWDQMLSQIKSGADSGITLTTIGFGMGNYHDTRMEQLADKGDGQSVYIDSEKEAEKLFVQGLSGTLVTVARDTKIQVEFNEDSVHAYRLIGYENRDIADADFRDDRVDAGEVGSGHEVTALYQVLLRDDHARELATVRIRWEEPGPDSEATEKSVMMSARLLRESVELASSDLRMAFASATFAEVLRQSPHVSEVPMSALIRLAEGAQSPDEESHVELIELMHKASKLGAGASGVAER